MPLDGNPWPWEDKPCTCRECTDGPGIDYEAERASRGWSRYLEWAAHRARLAQTRPD